MIPQNKTKKKTRKPWGKVQQALAPAQRRPGDPKRKRRPRTSRGAMHVGVALGAKHGRAGVSGGGWKPGGSSQASGRLGRARAAEKAARDTGRKRRGSRSIPKAASAPGTRRDAGGRRPPSLRGPTYHGGRPPRRRAARSRPRGATRPLRDRPATTRLGLSARSLRNLPAPAALPPPA